LNIFEPSVVADLANTWLHHSGPLGRLKYSFRQYARLTIWDVEKYVIAPINCVGYMRVELGLITSTILICRIAASVFCSFYQKTNFFPSVRVGRLFSSLRLHLFPIRGRAADDNLASPCPMHLPR
jgi:hypothetical protein